MSSSGSRKELRRIRKKPPLPRPAGVLLVNSTVTQEHPWLLDLLEENQVVTMERFRLLPPELQAKIRSEVPRILQVAQGEWVAINRGFPMDDRGEDKSNWLRCSLCGTPNRYIYFIRNIRTGSEMNVGSECVEDYLGGEKRLLEGKSRSQLLREIHRSKKLSLINDLVPGFLEALYTWNRPIEEAPFIIPLRIERQLADIRRKAIRLRDEVIASRQPHPSLLDELRQVIVERAKILEEMKRFCSKWEGDWRAPTRAIANWCLSRGYEQVITMLKEDESITHRTVHRIQEEGFLRRIEPLVKGLCSNVGIDIIKVAQDGWWWYRVLEPPMTFKINHWELLIRVGQVLIFL